MLILCYHRVTEALADPWGLCVAPERFLQHMEILRQSMHPMPLRELVDAAGRGDAPPRAVAVTFDDGYVDNLEAAAPTLERWGIPATVFVATGYVTSGQEFWWDAVQDLCLARETLPATLTLEIEGVAHTWQLGSDACHDRERTEAARGWRAWARPSTARQALYVDVWSRLRRLPEATRQAALLRLAAWADACGARRNDAHVPVSASRAMTPPQLREISATGLITLGAHTVTHPLLTVLPAEAQQREITESRRALEEFIGVAVTTFAYPYGDHASETRAAVKAAGLTLACGGGPGPVTVDSDRYCLPRAAVDDWEGPEFQSRLERWMER